MKLKDSLMFIMPASVLQLAKSLHSGKAMVTYRLSGVYQSFDEVGASITSYGKELILEKTKTVLPKVESQ